jgi:hypothetical protein
MPEVITMIVRRAAPVNRWRPVRREEVRDARSGSGSSVSSAAGVRHTIG